MTVQTSETFRRTFDVGTIDTGYARRAKVTVELTYNDGRVSFQADARRPGARDIDQGGQMQDTIREELEAGRLELAPGMTAERLGRILDLWDRWHLNDMRAGCEHQRAYGWADRRIDESKPADAYGKHFEGQRQDSWNLLGWIPPSELAGGLLGAPCAICGYKYGTAWLREDVPAEVLGELRTV